MIGVGVEGLRSPTPASTTPSAATPAPAAARIGLITYFLVTRTFRHRRGRFNFTAAEQLPANFSDHNSVACSLTHTLRSLTT